MLKIFTPQTKAQKDRAVMFETDSRMAKYSRRGLVLSFIAYLLCLSLGQFYQQAPRLAILLGIGVLLTTLLRAYFLFRFDALYARAPGRWRNYYFLVSIIGAAWWGITIFTITLKLGMKHETPILFLYSAVFYSSVANVFAPYRRFLAIYLILGQFPLALAAAALGTFEGYLYAGMMVVLMMLLNNQGEVTSRSYWERIEAIFALNEKTKGLEEQQRGTLAAVDFKNEFLNNLGLEFRTSLNDLLGSLSLLEDSSLDERQRELLSIAEKVAERQLDLINNVVDFSKISNKELLLDVSVFNLRHFLESLVEDLADDAHQQGVEFNYGFDADLPARVKGDVVRLGQILSNLSSHIIKFSERGSVQLRAGFQRESDSAGRLDITVSDEGGLNGTEQEMALDPNAKCETTQAGMGLSISICKALAECMGGSVNMLSQTDGGKLFSFSISLDMASSRPQPLNSPPKLRGRRLLIVEESGKTLEALADELRSWDLQVKAIADYTAARQELLAAAAADNHYHCVLLSGALNNLDLLDYSKALSDETPLQGLKQIFALSHSQQMQPQVKQMIEANSSLALIGKPAMRQPLLESLGRLLCDISTNTESDDGKHDHSQGIGQRVLLVEDHRVNQMVAKGMLEKLGYQVKVANNGIEAVQLFSPDAVDIILMDCQMPEMDGFAATQEIRRLESLASDDKTHTPVIAMTAHTAEGDQSRCLAAGMDDYLAKPVRYDELEARLRRWLGTSIESTASGEVEPQ